MMQLKAGVALSLSKEYKQTEIGVIPSDWDVIELESLTTKIGSGITPTGGSSVYKEDGRPFVRSQNVGWGNLLLDDIAYIDDETHQTFPNTELKLNDVFLNISGASIGRSSYANSKLVGGNVNQHVCIIRPIENKLNPVYLNLFLISKNGQKQIDSFQSGGNRQGLNIGQIRTFQIPVPKTIVEQTLIATALSDADALISSLEKLIAKKRSIKQGAMQKLLQPKEGDGLSLSKGWEVKKLGDVGIIVTGSTPPTQIKEYWNGSIPWITPTDILNTQKDIFNSEREITNLGLQVIRKLPADTLLVTCIASIGKNAILRNDGACNQQINAIIPSSKTNVEFLYFLIENSKPYLIGKAGITATMMISKKEFSEITYSFPAFEEQTRIATILSDMDAEITALETKLAKYKKVKLGMMQNLLMGKIRLV